MKNPQEEYNKYIKLQSSIIKKTEKIVDKITLAFKHKINDEIKSILPIKRTRISGVKAQFGDYVIGISSNKIFLRFKRSGLNYDLDICKGDDFLSFIPIEEKIKLIEKLSKV